MTSLLAEAQTTYLAAFHWSGCYVLRVLPHKSQKRTYADFPRRFLLTSLPAYQDDFRIEALEAKDEKKWPFASWQPKDAENIKIWWSTGFVGYEVSLTESGSRLLGTARFHTDSDPPNKFPELKIDARRIACGSLKTN